MMTNVVSAVRLHDLLRNYDGLERYVHVTTPEVYGSTEGWVRRMRRSIRRRPTRCRAPRPT